MARKNIKPKQVVQESDGGEDFDDDDFSDNSANSEESNNVIQVDDGWVFPVLRAKPSRHEYEAVC